MKKTLMKALTLLAIAAPAVALAVPAQRKPVKFRQPDGTVVTLLLHGDEHSRYATDQSGYPVEMAKNGFYYYIGNDGLMSDAVLTTQETASGRSKARGIATMKPADVLKKYLDRRPKAEERKVAPAKIAAVKGERKVPVLLVQFPGSPFTIGSKEIFEDMMNKEGYDFDGATGSCLDYFKQNSGGLFTPKFEVFGPVTLDNKVEYYGQNGMNNNDMRFADMIKEACLKLDDQVDFSQYDNDGDGIVDYVYVYYAGKGEHDTGISTLIWPQSWTMSDTEVGTFECDGVTIDRFATSNELQGNGKFAGIGVFVHEFSHILGLPDLYASVYNPDVFAPGDWSILAHGPYNNEGRTPPNYSAYERSELGWLELKELTKPDDITINPITSNTAYRITTENPNEYYVFENRQQEGWDKYIPGHGMLVWHIDYNETRWKNNVVNNDPKHQYVDLVEADNKLDELTRAGDAFPGTANITAFTDDTTPSMISWGGVRQNKPITDIAESADGIITFKVMGGIRNMFAPTDVKAENVAPTSFMLKWKPCDDCEYQTVNVYTKDANGEKQYAEGYEDKHLETTETSCLIQGLKPSTTYYVTVAASTPYEQKACDEIEVTTSAPTFDMMSPVTAEPTAVTNTGFTANWLPMDGADSYELTVKKRIIDMTQHSETCDFAGKKIQEGWTGKVSAYFSASGYYGEAAPSASLSEVGANVQSREYGSVQSVSLWMRTMTYSDKCSLKLLGLTESGEWTEFVDMPMPQVADGAMTKSWNIDETLSAGKTVKAVRLEFASTSPTEKAGKLLIDDVKIGYLAPDVDEVFADFSHKPTGNVTSYTVEGLESNKLYFYTVRGVSNGVKSMDSKERIVQLGTSGISQATSDNAICVTGNAISINAAAGCHIQIFAVDGATISSFTAQTANIYTTTLRSGIYLIRIADKTYKVKI